MHYWNLFWDNLLLKGNWASWVAIATCVHYYNLFWNNLPVKEELGRGGFIQLSTRMGWKKVCFCVLFYIYSQQDDIKNKYVHSGHSKVICWEYMFYFWFYRYVHCRFICIYSLDFSSCLLEIERLQSRENTTVSAAIFCPVVCISDVISKTGTCRKSIKYVKNQLFLLFIGKARSNVTVRWGGRIRNKNSRPVCIKIVRTTNWSISMKVFVRVPRYQPHVVFGSVLLQAILRIVNGGGTI